MTRKGIFLSEGELRPIWRCLLSALLIGAAVLLVALALGFVFHGLGRRPEMFEALSWTSVLMLPALLAIFRFMTAVFDRRPLASVGLAFHARWRAELARGLVVGAAMILLVAGLQTTLGFARFSLSPEAPFRLLKGALLLGFVLLIAATNEELIFRGYPFQRLMDAIGPAGAIAVFSVLFGLGHLMNPDHTWISTLNTMLVGVPLAVAYVRTRALWLPIGIHLSWNFLQGYALGLPVSGLALPARMLTPVVSGPEWVTGGAYGPEGGVLASGVIVAATLYLLVARRIYITEDMKKLACGPPPRPEAPISSLSLAAPGEEQ
jgi:hypothetical protein